MFRRPTNTSGQPVASRDTSRRTVCVVDPCREAYEPWRETAPALGVELRFVSSAAAALTLARTEKIDLWVINSKLPGISGSELCAMLKSQHVAATVCIVADEYSAADEQTAWSSRATLFLCKPAHTAWLPEWLASSRRAPASRASVQRPAAVAVNR